MDTIYFSLLLPLRPTLLHPGFCGTRWTRKCGPLFWPSYGSMGSRSKTRTSGNFWLSKLWHGYRPRKVLFNWSDMLNPYHLVLLCYHHEWYTYSYTHLLPPPVPCVPECVAAGNALLGCQVQKETLGLWEVLPAYLSLLFMLQTLYLGCTPTAT